MDRKIKINSLEVLYKVRQSKRAKNLSISVESDTHFEVVMPNKCNEKKVMAFILENKEWIIKKLALNKKYKTYIDIKDKPYHKYKARARMYILQRVEAYCNKYGFKYKKITIKNQKCRWGSCSNNDILNFNYKLLFLPSHLTDYIVVHELCHLHELNHSKRFWKLVCGIIPEYKKCERELKKIAFK